MAETLHFPVATPPAPGEVTPIAPGVLWLRMPLPFALNHINLWLLEDGPGWTIVDCGFAGEQTTALWEQIFAGHPYGHAPAGTVAGLGNVTLEQAIESHQQWDSPGNMFSVSRYAENVRAWQEQFGADRVLVVLYDDLEDKPQAYLDQVTSFIGIPAIDLGNSPVGADKINEMNEAPKSYKLARRAREFREWLRQRRLYSISEHCVPLWNYCFGRGEVFGPVDPVDEEQVEAAGPGPRFGGRIIAGLVMTFVSLVPVVVIAALAGGAAAAEVAPGTLVPDAGDTTYLSVVDRDGNMVSLIESNYAEFGSGLVAEGTGFVLHDRGALFSLDPASPNALAGHKRPLHTIIPAFLQKDQVRIAFGIMGGWNQAQAHAQFVSHVVDFNQNIQAALETARFTKLSFTGCDLDLENRVADNVRAELEAKGHQLRMHHGYSDTFGGGQAVMRDYASGVNYGASDPRKDGAAIPEMVNPNWPSK